MSTLDDIKKRVEGHTEGPWRVWKGDLGRRSAVVETAWGYDGDSAEQITDWCSPADAELIAAAPKLLAALEAVESKAAENEARAEWLYDTSETTKAYYRGKQHGFNLARLAIKEALS